MLLVADHMKGTEFFHGFCCLLKKCVGVTGIPNRTFNLLQTFLKAFAVQRFIFLKVFEEMENL